MIHLGGVYRADSKPPEICCKPYFFMVICMVMERNPCNDQSEFRMGRHKGRSESTEARRFVHACSARVSRSAPRHCGGSEAQSTRTSLLLRRRNSGRCLDGPIHVAATGNPNHRRWLLARGQGNL